MTVPDDIAFESQQRLRLALRLSALLWFLLLFVGFFAPGGWTWGMPGPIGHMQNYVISLWIAVLVLAPLLAARNPVLLSGALVVYVLGIAAVLLSTVRSEPPELLSDGPPWVVALVSVGLLVWADPQLARRTLHKLFIGRR